MDIKEVIQLLQSFAPVSIFVYGSRSANCENEQSDYEIGVVFREDNYVGRSIIKQKIADDNYSIFPFRENDLLAGEIDTPFQKNIFLNSLIEGNAKTIFGKRIVENLPKRKISVIDLLMDSSFNLGYATAAVRVMKEGNINLANDLFCKSILYSTRNLIFFKKAKFIVGYENIYKESKKLALPEEYEKLLEVAIALRRQQDVSVDSSVYFKNITYINKFIIPILQGGLT